jgi:hypothetical protein
LGAADGERNNLTNPSRLSFLVGNDEANWPFLFRQWFSISTIGQNDEAIGESVIQLG